MTTYNTIVKSNEIDVLDEVVKRCPYECAELEPGKYGFMDNGKGDVRNYFCDTLGYECSNYDAFDFEYFDEPQTKSNELIDECKEEFAELIQNSSYAIEFVNDSAEEIECELIVNFKANGQRTNLYLYAYCGKHIDDYFTGVYYYKEGLTYDEAGLLSEKFNEYRGKRVCSDGSDELRINFGCIDEAVLFEKWLNDKENKNKPNFYTPNGWEGSKYDSKKGTKEVAKELRAYIKANPDLNACKWSITSKRGMCADSLYISLMAAPFDPFSDEYKTRYEYRYNRGYSEHGDIEENTTSEAYKLIKKVKSFVMQYIYDDSDGMIDYFDRNIYDHYEIGKFDKPFQIIEKKESKKQGEPAGEPNEAKTSETVPVPEGLEIVDYSEKAIAVFGDTKSIKEELKAIGGKFNPALKNNGEKRAGWIFSKKQADKVRALLAPASEPSESVTLPEPPKEIDVTDILEKVDFAKAAKTFIQEWRNNNPYPGSDYLDEFNAKFNREYSAFVEKWAKDNGRQINSYMLPNPYPIERGEYKETELDRQKKQADILLESIDGNWYTIRLNREIELKSKRIKRYDNGCIAVPESLFHKLESKYNVMCNF